MKRTVIWMVVLLAGCEAPVNQEAVSHEGETILVGQVNWQGLTSVPYSEWFIPGYQSYVVDSLALAGIAPSMLNLEIVLYLGTWCEDSQLQVPQFYKILDYLQFDQDRMTVIGLERLEDLRLVGPQHEELDWEVGFVPTIIFVSAGRKMGRITEFPQQSLEKDMARIVGNNLSN